MGSAANGGWSTTTAPASGGMPFSMGGGGQGGDKPSAAQQGMQAAQTAMGGADDPLKQAPGQKPIDLGMLTEMLKKNQSLGT